MHTIDEVVQGTTSWAARVDALERAHEELLSRPNEPVGNGWGIFDRYRHPVLTMDHVPLHWRYDFNPETNPYLMERMGIDAVFNSGAMKFQGRYVQAARIEGADRKSFFAIAESPNGVDNWRFWDFPIRMPETERRDVNVYDMRLIQHEDGWIYGVFCTERKDEAHPRDLTAAEAQVGIARTHDLLTWERLPDLKTRAAQQRNAVLHPEFVNGKYGFYTRPQDGFIDIGSGGGVGWGVCDDITHAEIGEEVIVSPKRYHTITEVKNGEGATPIKTAKGWLHIVHGVRNTAAGLRYVVYIYVTDLKEPWRVTHAPAGYLIAPRGAERVGDVSNVIFCGGWTLDDDGTVFIYYASSDTRMHVGRSDLGRLLDYCKNTPADPLFTADCVEQRYDLIRRNLEGGRAPRP